MAAFQSAAKRFSENGSTYSLPKESMNGKMPLRILLVAAGWVLTLYLIRILNRLFSRVCAAYRRKLRDEYANRLLGWLLLRAVGLLIGYAACVAALAGLFVVLIQPVFTFPEWVPAVLVEPQDIAAAFWNVWQDTATVMELRTPEVLRSRFFSRLMGWACGFGALALGCLWGGLRQEFNRLPLLREKPERAEEKDSDC